MKGFLRSKKLRGSSSPAQAPLAPDVEILFRRFVFDQIPVRLIHLPTMKLLDRNTLISHFRPNMESITEEDIKTKQDEKPTATRNQIVGDMIKDRVRYAIFSHRWLNEGEPTYEDMTKNKRPTGAGYEKLKAFCRTAESHGVMFAWSDTCCIDKTSSAELDESIRSMFRWYRNSSICVAYLANTFTVDKLGDDEWFRRGWTLQELLAPKHIKFYGGKWDPLTDTINDLDHPELLKEIENATTIRARFLQGRQFVPGPKDIAERMCWAAKRVTSRGEDRAYSLMGIFGVSLSIAYGEGPDYAFFRLVEAILQVSNNLDLLNWAGEPAATSHPTRMLPSSPDCYLMRNRSTLPALNSPQYLTLTNRGLRLELLIVRATLSSATPQASDRAVFIPDRRHIEEDKIEVKGSTESVNKGISSEYAFGLWSIVEDGLDSRLVAPLKVTGCLIYRFLPGPWKRIPLQENIILTTSQSLRSRPLGHLLETVFL
ncbi:hypothetical protein EDB19DRAFT_1717330 [Suillus lakei]|nr:hypothetical protein EDB19DRAFT_1717330 [Suillus lakei]